MSEWKLSPTYNDLIKLHCNLIIFRDFEKPDIPAYSSKAHTEIINCIDGVGGLSVGCGAPEIVTGSRDGILN